MNITFSQVESLRSSLTQVGAKPDVLFYAFHTRLSMLTPTMRLIIAGDLRERGEALFQLLITAVDHIHDRPLATASVWAFNEWLSSYGKARIKDEVVKEALLWALGRVLGIEMFPLVLLAWCDLISRLREIDQELGDLYYVETTYVACPPPALHVTLN
ncbi:MAG: hypothetical protein KF716_18745 [Anaerolineae bacterium]|nr:hypothetical protein [Anaerolineae bacterium]